MIKDWGFNLLGLKHKIKSSSTEPPPTDEQYRKIIDLADDIEKLVAIKGWDHVCNHITAEVNASIGDAKRLAEVDPEKGRIAVVRWGAKQELADSLIAMIDSAISERDRLVEQYKQYKESQNGGTGNAGY